MSGVRLPLKTYYGSFLRQFSVLAVGQPLNLLWIFPTPIQCFGRRATPKLTMDLSCATQCLAAGQPLKLTISAGTYIVVSPLAGVSITLASVLLSVNRFHCLLKLILLQCRKPYPCHRYILVSTTLSVSPIHADKWPLNQQDYLLPTLVPLCS